MKASNRSGTIEFDVPPIKPVDPVQVTISLTFDRQELEDARRRTNLSRFIAEEFGDAITSTNSVGDILYAKWTEAASA